MSSLRSFHPTRDHDEKMKTFLLHRTAGEPLTPVCGVVPAEILPDTAVTRKGQPVYLPYIEGEWRAEAVVVARVSRLAKGVEPRFAMRHIDAIAPAVRLVPVTLGERLQALAAPTALAAAFDCALTVGPFIEIDGAPACASLGIAASPGEASTSYSAPLADLPEAASALSRYVTLRSGDMIAPLRAPEQSSIPVSEDTLLTVTMTLPCGTRSELRVKIK